MHTYRKGDSGGWYVYFQRPDEPVGPGFDEEFEAAAFAAFMNGGRYSPNEIEPIFPKEYPPVEADDEPEDHTTPPSKGNFADYPHEQTKKRQEVGTS
jgi:hypothetical protein